MELTTVQYMVITTTTIITTTNIIIILTRKVEGREEQSVVGREWRLTITKAKFLPPTCRPPV